MPLDMDPIEAFCTYTFRSVQLQHPHAKVQLSVDISAAHIFSNTCIQHRLAMKQAHQSAACDPMPLTPPRSRTTPETPSTSRTIPETEFGSSPIALSSPLTVRAQSPDAKTYEAGNAISEKSVPVPRFAALGLNRTHARKLKSKDMLLNMGRESSVILNHSEFSQTTCQRNWLQDDEDLRELEELMVPDDIRSAQQDRGFLPTRRWQPINKIKTSKYTTGLLTDTGWQPIQNPYWNAMAINVPTTEEFIATNRLSEALSVVDLSIDEDDVDEAAKPGIKTVAGVSKIDEAEDQTGKWELLEGDISSPRSGQSAPEKLTIRLRNMRSHEPETWSFRKIKHEDIDWSDKTHIQEISKWRCQIFRRRGFLPKKLNVMYAPEEDAWLMLSSRKLKAAAEAGSVFKLPGPITTMEAFNIFFKGKLLKDESGKHLPPRQARDEASLKGKLSNKKLDIWKLRDVTRKLLEGKKGGRLDVPIISEDELRRYRTTNTVVTDNPEDVRKNAALGAEAIKSRRTVPKRNRDPADCGEQGTKRVKQTLHSQAPAGKNVTSSIALVPS